MSKNDAFSPKKNCLRITNSRLKLRLEIVCTWAFKLQFIFCISFTFSIFNLNGHFKLCYLAKITHNLPQINERLNTCRFEMTLLFCLFRQSGADFATQDRRGHLRWTRGRPCRKWKHLLGETRSFNEQHRRAHRKSKWLVCIFYVIPISLVIF